MRSADKWIAKLRMRLEQELPGQNAQLRMAPAHRPNTNFPGIDVEKCREAAVLALLYPKDDALYLVLTVRPDHMEDHAGQISFPGGRRDEGEELIDTALREAHEEVDLDPADVDVIGRLSPLYIPPSNFCVYPFVGFCPSEPDLVPSDAEVATILHVPIAQLFSDDARVRETWTLHGAPVEVPFFHFETYKIWGATAMMLSELEAVVQSVDEAAV